MAHEHSVFNTDELFLIDPNTRTITQQSGKNRLMQYDHNSERFEFQIPRYIEGHDMSLCNDIKVNYINLSSCRDEQTNGPYVVKDMQIDPKDSDKIVFSWLISRNATKYAGTLNFNISFRCLTGAIIDYAWYTDVFKGITVGAGIENNGSEYSEDYIDILEQWKQELLAGLDSVDGVVTSVNGIGPDENGNVEIAILESNVKTVNGQNPDESGNILIDIPTDEHINSLVDDRIHDVTIVKTVNGLSPDSDGNVELDVQESFSGSWNDLTDKPFYVERQNVTHDSITVGIYNLGYATLPFEFFPGVGESYTIIWDGTSYACSAVTAAINDEEVIVVGSTAFFGGSTNTDIPFGIISRSGRALVYSSESGELTITISGYEHIPHKIPREYVDYNPIVGVIDSSYYNYRYLNPARGASIAEVRKAAVEGDRDIIIRLDLDNWQGTLRYMGLTNVSTDGTNYVSALLFSTIKANDISINDSDEAIDGTMQLEYWYALLEPTEGPPADAFVNFQFAEINLAPGTSKAGYYMRVNENGLWEATEGISNVSELTNDAGYITAEEVPEGFSGSWNDLSDRPFGEIAGTKFTTIFSETIESANTDVQKPWNYAEIFDCKNAVVYYNGMPGQYDVVITKENHPYVGDYTRFTIGDTNLSDLPFYISGSDSGGLSYVYVKVREVNASIRVEVDAPYYTMVPEEFIPSTIARKEDIPTVPTNVSSFSNDAGYLTAPATAQVGQTIVVKAVDENGKPTEWEAADMASGGTTIIHLKASESGEYYHCFYGTESDGDDQPVGSVLTLKELMEKGPVYISMNNNATLRQVLSILAWEFDKADITYVDNSIGTSEASLKCVPICND